MAKITEGDPYYYILSNYPEAETYNIFKREHSGEGIKPLASRLTKENASLIVDALNYYETNERAQYKHGTT